MIVTSSPECVHKLRTEMPTSNLIKTLQKRQVFTGRSVPTFLTDSVQYITMMGSVAYGVSDVVKGSDVDIYGFCIPPKEILFPHTAGRASPERYSRHLRYHTSHRLSITPRCFATYHECLEPYLPRVHRRTYHTRLDGYTGRPASLPGRGSSSRCVDCPPL